MTITEKSPEQQFYDELVADILGKPILDTQPPGADRLTEVLAMLFADEPPLPTHTLLDVPDIERAMRLLDKTRIQPRYEIDDYDSLMESCLYSDPHTGMPDCIAGTVIALLAPSYFALISSTRASVRRLDGIGDMFTSRAIELMQLMQYNADAQQPWGEAYLRARIALGY